MYSHFFFHLVYIYFTNNYDPKLWKRQVCPNSLDPDQTAPLLLQEQSDQVQQFATPSALCGHILLYGKSTLFNFQDDNSNF